VIECWVELGMLGTGMLLMRQVIECWVELGMLGRGMLLMRQVM